MSTGTSDRDGPDRPASPLDEIVRRAGASPRPVHLWNPARSGVIDIRILADGAWTHEGRPIRRDALVGLFSEILKRDADGYWLVTPAEKLRIEVEDVPFLAVRVDRIGDDLVFETNVGERVRADADHRIELRPGPDGGARPYLHVRAGLWARIARPVYYELVELAEAVGEGEATRLSLSSAGARFDLGAAGSP